MTRRCGRRNSLGKTILSYGAEAVEYCGQMNQELLEEMEGIPELEKAYGAPFREDGQRLAQLLETMRSGDWDGCCQQLKTFSFGRLGALRGFEDDVLKRRIQSGRDQIKRSSKGYRSVSFVPMRRNLKRILQI